MDRASLSSRRGLWFIMGAATLWGTTGVVTQAVYDLRPTNALSITFLRLGIAALVLLLLCWRRLGRRLWQVKRRDALLMLCMGAMQATSQYCYFAAIANSGVTIATMVTICLAPVMVVLLAALFLREQVTGRILLALLGALVGTALLTGAPSGQRPFGSLLVGVLLSLISAATYAMVILLARVLSGRYHSLQVNVASFASGALLLLGCSLLTTPLVLSYPAVGWLLLFYMGVVPTALAYMLFQVGLRSTPATLTSILTFCEPLTAAILAWLLFGERLSLLGLLGAALLLGTMLLLALAQPAPVAAQASE
ncbi:MAG TPA: EamA family transporter [Ktedonobacterales bacterium]|nr:EamA family transporter [Ktedonobacterales bacterium]